MASPTPKRAPTPRQHPPRPPAGPPEIIDPFWLLKALVVTVIAAAFCAWLTLCLLVYQGQWQLLLHPEPSLPLSTTLPIQHLRFGASETGQPSLAGLWLPAAEGSPPTSPTILYLPDGSANLAANLPTLTLLHQLPLNLFAFDYRGFGASDPTPHPNQARMAADAASALDYLINTRHIDPHEIVLYGAGFGASLAAQLAVENPGLPAIILESAQPNPARLAAADPRTRFVPFTLLFHERFEIAPNLATLHTPKLLLTAGPSHLSATPSANDLDTLYKSAATPSYTAHLSPWLPDSRKSVATYRESILRFLNAYLPANSPQVPEK